MSGSTGHLDLILQILRLAEMRRSEELQMMEWINKYNIGSMVFNGSFLSLLVTASFDSHTLQVAGFFCIISMMLSVIGIWPTVLKATLLVEDDIAEAKKGNSMSLPQNLIATADVTTMAANNIAAYNKHKKAMAGSAIAFLATSIIVTYIRYTYA